MQCWPPGCCWSQPPRTGSEAVPVRCPVVASREEISSWRQVARHSDEAGSGQAEAAADDQADPVEGAVHHRGGLRHGRDGDHHRRGQDLQPGFVDPVGRKLSCMVWHKDEVTVLTVLTMKKSLMENYDLYPRTYDYRQGLVVPGVVTLIKKFGIFLRVPHLSKPVLCPTRMLQSYFVEDTEAVLEVGQTVMAKVMDVDSEDTFIWSSLSSDL